MYAVIHGSDMFIGTSGILSYEIDGRLKEFFKIREIDRNRSEGSYISVDVDIKDIDGNREVKLFKSKPVVASEDVKISYTKEQTTVRRPDGSIIIDIELLRNNDPSLPSAGPVRQALDSYKLDAIIRITGNYMAGKHKVQSTTEKTTIGYITMGGNLAIGTGGIVLRDMGFSF